jgi:putative FmdB family regulatory protein
MPLYEYQCENCGDVFELIQKFSDEPTAIHEKCGGKVHRLISAPALQFKGTGWYVTDYAKGGSNNPANGGKKEGDASSKESAAAAASSDGSKSDTSKSEGSKSETSKPASTTAATTSDKTNS